MSHSPSEIVPLEIVPVEIVPSKSPMQVPFLPLCLLPSKALCFQLETFIN